MGDLLRGKPLPPGIQRRSLSDHPGSIHLSWVIGWRAVVIWAVRICKTRCESAEHEEGSITRPFHSRNYKKDNVLRVVIFSWTTKSGRLWFCPQTWECVTQGSGTNKSKQSSPRQSLTAGSAKTPKFQRSKSGIQDIHKRTVQIKASMLLRIFLNKFLFSQTQLFMFHV